MLWLMLSLGAGVAPSSPPPETREDPLAVLEDLTRRCNALEGFHARYRFDHPEEGESLIELWYQAPDSMRLDWRDPDSPQQVQTWIVDGRMALAIVTEDGERSHAAADPSEARLYPVGQLVEELFPETAGAQLGPGPRLTWSWGVEAETDEIGLEIAASWLPRERSSLVGWLDRLAVDPDLLHVEEELLVQDHPRYRASVSRATGFLTELVLHGNEGSTGRFHLEELDVDASLDPEVFEIPARSPGARDVSEEMLASMYPPGPTRQQCFYRIDRLLADRHVDWSLETREDAEAVFRALHEILSQGRREAREQSITRWIEAGRESISGRREAGEGLEELREQVALARDNLESGLEEFLSDMLEEVESLELSPGRSSRWEGLLEIERRAVRSLHDDLLVQPLLEAFDTAMAEALGD